MASEDEATWQPARIIPTSGITGPDEAERRATSALLAVMGAVREFGTAMLRPLGAPGGSLTTFIEVPFKVGEGICYPDGLLRVARGSKSWTALVEVKTAAAVLERPQVETYLDVAREHGFDVVLTISNQLAPAPGVHPVDVDKRKLKKVALHHVSWAEVLTTAVQQRVHRGVSDPDQAWILAELIRYLEHPRSGAMDFSDMGASWVEVREAVVAGTLRANDKALPDVLSRWEQLLRFAALRLGRELGADVEVQVSRKEAADPALRISAQSQLIVGQGKLSGTLRIPDAIAPLDVVADLRAGQVIVSVGVEAPKDGRPVTRVNWLARQLADAPGGLRVDAFVANARTSTSDLLRIVRENPAVLIDDPKKEIRTFRVAATSALGTKRGTGRGGFIDSVLASVDGFYEAVVQQLRPWAAKAPQLPKGGSSAAEDAGLVTEPPPLDATDPLNESFAAPAPVGADVPDVVVEAATEPAASLSGTLAPSDGADEEIVQWDDAHGRLDHEREGQEAIDG